MNVKSENSSHQAILILNGAKEIQKQKRDQQIKSKGRAVCQMTMGYELTIHHFRFQRYNILEATFLIVLL